MKMRKSSCLLFLVIGLTACAELSSRSIPEPFLGQIVTLHHDRAEIAKKRQDLEKEISALDAQERWDCERESLVAAQAIQSLKLSTSEYQVNLDRMSITPVRTK